MIKLWLFYQRLYFRIFFLLSKEASAEALFRFFTTPRRHTIRERDKKALENSRQSSYDFNGTTIQCYHWGKGNKKVLLIHGWEGNAGNFGYIAQALSKQGYEVLAFDAPAHGKSGGKTTHLFEFSALIARLIRDHGPFEKIITHSFGSGATVFALHQHPELSPAQLSMITSPNRYADAFLEFGHMIGLGNKQLVYLFSRIQDRFGYSPDDLVVARWINDLPIAKLQLLHDPHDKIIRFERAEKIAAACPTLELVRMEGAGHYRILWQADTITHLLS